MTGAPIPAGSDAVIPFEETSVEDGHVVVKGRVTVGQHIRFRAEDVREGDVVLPGRDASPSARDQHAGLPREGIRPGLPEGPGRGAVHRRRADRARGGAVPRHDHQQQQPGDRRRRPGGGRGSRAPRHRARRPGKPCGEDPGRFEGGRPDHHRRGVGGRPGPGAGGAGGGRGRLPLLEGRHQAGRTDRLRDEGREAGLLPPREPGVRADHVRGVRPARASPDDGAEKGGAAAGQGDPHRRGAEETGEGALPPGRDRGPGRGVLSPLPPGTRTPGSSGRWSSPTPSRSFRPTEPPSPRENGWTSSCLEKRSGEGRRLRDVREAARPLGGPRAFPRRRRTPDPRERVRGLPQRSPPGRRGVEAVGNEDPRSSRGTR